MKPLLTVAVTGGSGQLGTLVLQRLIEEPEVERIISIDRRPPIVGSAKLQTVIADVRDPALSRYLDGVDAVIHCAFIIRGQERSPTYRAVNVDGSKNVFQAAAAAGVESIAVVSSITAYGCVAGHPIPIVETTPRVRQADFAYACCKFDVEAFLDEVEPQHPDIAVSRIRANVLIGRRVEHLLGIVLRIGWIPDLGVPLPVVWDEDVADLLVLAAKRRARGAFNAAADELLPSAELAQRTGMTSVRVSRILLFMQIAFYELLSRLNVHLLSDPSWITKTKVPLIASSERARRELGWSPRFPTAVALIDHFRAVSPWRLDVGLLAILWALSRITRGAQRRLTGHSTRLFLCLNGPVAGDFSMLLQNGQIKVGAGAPSRPTSTITMTDGLFRDLLAGRITIDAAFTSGLIDCLGVDSDRELFKQIITILCGNQRSDSLWRNFTARLVTQLC